MPQAKSQKLFSKKSEKSLNSHYRMQQILRDLRQDSLFLEMFNIDFYICLPSVRPSFDYFKRMKASRMKLDMNM